MAGTIQNRLDNSTVQRLPKMKNNIAVTGMSFDLMTADNKWS
jgi:hypothetical protein